MKVIECGNNGTSVCRARCAIQLLAAEMRIGVPIILFVAVAGFHSVISASLQCDERTKLPEDRAFEENSTTPQADKPEYEAAHVKASQQKTEHSEQAEANVKSFEDFSDEEYGRYYDY
ncbi:histone-lysine N-methyltransferase SETD1B-like protein [Labeo rohita]|uniref:Histone-lysine N-methyltransferase SETD1B-like protein n=1 Tax=Labeo rohita TaxID=84645 RepID=A0A498NU00_LABRO|nr:histone-lysine N-methyltransferase SETD1B-like protein [Labeo rohita]